MDVGVESNIGWLLFLIFQIFQQQIIKKGEAEARNEASKDQRHLLFALP